MSANDFTPSDPITEPTIVDLPEQQTIVARYENVTMDRIREVMDAGFGAIGAALQQGGLQPIGGAFSKYDRMPDQPFSIEIGFPLAQALDEPEREGDEVVIPSSLPATRAATVSYVGNYDGLGDAWGRFMQWVHENGHTPGEGFWEVYVTEPTPGADPETMRTDLVLPLAD